MKNQKCRERGQIFVHDIGDYLDSNQKLSIIKNFGSIYGIKNAAKFSAITPDVDNDWVNQGDKTYGTFMIIGDKSKRSIPTIFRNYSRGFETGRDAWNYNFSKTAIKNIFARQATFYNSEVARFAETESPNSVRDFVNNDPRKISWTSSLHDFLKKGIEADIDIVSFDPSIYRPFTKSHMVRHRLFVHRVGGCSEFRVTGIV